MPDGAAFLEIKHLGKDFGTFAALDDVSVAVQEGAFVCFVGPSGCGKTTLLRTIAGLDRQSRGRIFRQGQEISALPPAARDCGIVFQSYALFPNLTVADNIAYGLSGGRRQRATHAARVAELLTLIGMEGMGGAYPAALSGGQQQRVALARAMARRPALLLLDEPLSALDAKVRLRLRGEIKELQRQLGVTTIMVTHDQEEALAMADCIVVMNGGRIEQVGTPAEIYGDPQSLFVAEFIGEMNRLAGHVGVTGQVCIAETRIATVQATTHGAVVVAIRPEDVVFGEGPHRAEIVSMAFLGAFWRIGLHAMGQDLCADVAASDVRRLMPEIGGTVAIDLRGDRLHVFPDGDAG